MAGDTSEGPGAGSQAGRCGQAGLWYRSEWAGWLRVAAFVRKAPGGLFCALKIHIKSILAASLVLFLPDAVLTSAGMWLRGGSPSWRQGKEGKVQPFAQGPPLLNTQRGHWSRWEMEACGKAQEESQGLERRGESGFFYCQMWVRLARAPCG